MSRPRRSGILEFSILTRKRAKSANRTTQKSALCGGVAGRWLGRWMRLAFIVFALLGVYLAFLCFQIYSVSKVDEQRNVDAIVVMGAAQYNGTPSPVLRARLDHALDLYRQHMASLVVVTGGKQEGDRFSEAESARNYLVLRGVPPNRILQEDEGRNSLESISAASSMLLNRGYRNVLMVSDPFHMLRVMQIARDYGLEPYSSPTRTSPISRNPDLEFRYVLREALTYTAYKLTGV